jgi:hypothetical protein
MGIKEDFPPQHCCRLDRKIEICLSGLDFNLDKKDYETTKIIIKLACIITGMHILYGCNYTISVLLEPDGVSGKSTIKGEDELVLWMSEAKQRDYRRITRHLAYHLSSRIIKEQKTQLQLINLNHIKYSNLP